MKNSVKIKNSFKLIKLVKPLTGYMILAILLGIIGNLMASFISILGGYGLIRIFKGLSFGLFIGVMLAFAVVRGVFRYGEQLSNHYIAFKLLAIIRDKVFKALRKLAPAKLDTKDKGNLISLITSDVELLEVFYAHTISPVLIALGTTVFMTIFIGSFHFLFGVVALLSYLAIGVAVPLIFSKKSGFAGMSYRKDYGALSSYLLEGLRGIDQVIQYQNGEAKVEEISKLTDKLIATEEKMKRNIGKNMAVVGLLISLSSLLLIFTGIYLYQNSLIGGEEIVISFLALISSFGPVIALASLGSSLQNTFGAAERIIGLLEEEPLIEEVKEGEERTFAGAICDNISFGYKEEEILRDLSLNIEKNRIIGLKGKSGAGKSTLIKLLMRFWDVDKGRIKVSGTDIFSLNTSNLRDMESYMTQEVELFNDTIRNNLKIARLEASDEEIIAACKKASIHDFISSLAKGYDSLIGELGDKLSGGEKQRLSLARAFLHEGDFILLDEPTSNLDILNEAIILKSLKDEAGAKTVLISSHRDSTMRIADATYLIEAGRVS